MKFFVFAKSNFDYIADLIYKEACDLAMDPRNMAILYEEIINQQEDMTLQRKYRVAMTQRCKTAATDDLTGANANKCKHREHQLHAVAFFAYLFNHGNVVPLDFIRSVNYKLLKIHSIWHKMELISSFIAILSEHPDEMLDFASDIRLLESCVAEARATDDVHTILILTVEERIFKVKERMKGITLKGVIKG